MSMFLYIEIYKLILLTTYYIDTICTVETKTHEGGIVKHEEQRHIQSVLLYNKYISELGRR